MPDNQDDLRVKAERYRSLARETADPAARQLLETYAKDIEDMLIAPEPNQQEG